MKIVVANTPFGILLSGENGGARLPLVEDGVGETDLRRVQNLLSMHNLVLVDGRVDVMSAPELEVLFVQAKPSGDAADENIWLATQDDLAAAMRTLAKCCSERGHCVYHRVAELLREHLSATQTA